MKPWSKKKIEAARKFLNENDMTDFSQDDEEGRMVASDDDAAQLLDAGWNKKNAKTYLMSKKLHVWCIICIFRCSGRGVRTYLDLKTGKTYCGHVPHLSIGRTLVLTRGTDSFTKEYGVEVSFPHWCDIELKKGCFCEYEDMSKDQDKLLNKVCLQLVGMEHKINFELL